MKILYEYHEIVELLKSSEEKYVKRGGTMIPLEELPESDEALNTPSPIGDLLDLSEFDPRNNVYLLIRPREVTAVAKNSGEENCSMSLHLMG